MLSREWRTHVQRFSELTFSPFHHSITKPQVQQIFMCNKDHPYLLYLIKKTSVWLVWHSVTYADTLGAKANHIEKNLNLMTFNASGIKLIFWNPLISIRNNMIIIIVILDSLKTPHKININKTCFIAILFIYCLLLTKYWNKKCST